MIARNWAEMIQQTPMSSAIKGVYAEGVLHTINRTILAPYGQGNDATVENWRATDWMTFRMKTATYAQLIKKEIMAFIRN